MSEASSSKKRKPVSDAERLALELLKLTPKHIHESKVKFEGNRIVFPVGSKNILSDSCTWKVDRMCPRYCEKAEIKCENYLPDRKFLVRYSVKCSTCYDEETTAVHLYCSHCDEILTGSIAGPGGKIADHLITIRHVYQEAITLNSNLERQGMPKGMEIHQAWEYLRILEEWSETIRYQKNSLKKPVFEELLKSLRRKLDQVYLPEWIVTMM
jgi:hypothetical protein